MTIINTNVKPKTIFTATEQVSRSGQQVYRSLWAESHKRPQIFILTSIYLFNKQAARQQCCGPVIKNVKHSVCACRTMELHSLTFHSMLYCLCLSVTSFRLWPVREVPPGSIGVPTCPGAAVAMATSAASSFGTCSAQVHRGVKQRAVGARLLIPADRPQLVVRRRRHEAARGSTRAQELGLGGDDWPEGGRPALIYGNRRQRTSTSQVHFHSLNVRSFNSSPLPGATFFWHSPHNSSTIPTFPNIESDRPSFIFPTTTGVI